MILGNRRMDLGISVGYNILYNNVLPLCTVPYPNLNQIYVG